MEQTNTLPPLVSDEDALTMARKEGSNWRVGNQSDAVNGAEETILAVRKIYEADRANTREVVQSLVDALWQFDGAVVYVGWDPAEREKHKSAKSSLALAKSQLNIEPTKP